MHMQRITSVLAGGDGEEQLVVAPAGANMRDALIGSGVQVCVRLCIYMYVCMHICVVAPAGANLRDALIGSGVQVRYLCIHTFMHTYMKGIRDAVASPNKTNTYVHVYIHMYIHTYIHNMYT